MKQKATLIEQEDNINRIAGLKLGLFDKDGYVINDKVVCGTGQITSLKTIVQELNLHLEKGNELKPDGWCLPTSKNEPAIIFEFKSEISDIQDKKTEEQLINYLNIIETEYKHTIGILYNGKNIRVFFDKIEKAGLAKDLQNKDYYINAYKTKPVDKQKIFNLTRKINDFMHFKLCLSNLYDRMIFTACVLASVKEGANIKNANNFNELKFKTKEKLEDVFKDKKTKVIPNKFYTLINIFNKIEITIPNPENLVIKELCDWIVEIADNITSDNWNGEDVMSIFFREFNRYKSKSEKGQVFTPENWASFMYKLLKIDSDCIVIDATAGSGTFLVYCLNQMIKEVGINSEKAEEIRNNRLYGIEFDKNIFALCVANMIIHKDGLSNLEHMDSLTSDASNWIKEKCKEAETKGLRVVVLMNPPYENKYGCLDIVKNVLDSLPKNAMAAFILPDKKLEKAMNKTKLILQNNRLEKIIKMPENVFDVGITTSIFVFKAGLPQNNEKIFSCYIEKDGLEVVKNQGRQDIKNEWTSIENEWIDDINLYRKKETIQWLMPSEHLSYQLKEKEVEIYEENFVKIIMDYEMFKLGIEVKDFNDKLMKKVLYSSEVVESEDGVSVILKDGE